jgi:tetratricopeptide (TPR) repeat protein
MYLAPNSEAVAKDVSYPEQQRKEPVVSGLARCLLTLILFALLPAGAGRAYAQQSASQFDDLAAQAAAARDQQNIPLAIELYGRAEQLQPDWAEGWWNLGLLHYSSDQFPPAIEAFSRFIQLQPTAAPAIALRGLCEFETGAYDDSLRDLEQAVAKGAADQPRNAQIIRYHLGLLLARAGRFQEALTQYAFFAAQHVTNPELMVAIGLAGMRTTSLPKDIPAQDRDMYQAAGNAGYVFLSGDSVAADDLFRQLYIRYPAIHNLHFFYGFLLFPHAPDLAIEQFQGEVTLAPTDVSARAMLAFTLMIAGHYTDAVTEAEKVYAAEPNMEMAQLALGRSLAETGDMQRGLVLLNKVLARDPNNMEAHLGLVAIYSRAGRREDAYRERRICLGLAK